MAKSPEEQEASMIANLAEKTGRTLAAWVALAQESGSDRHGGIVAHLKSAHGLTHGYANLVAHHALRSGASASAPEDLVAAQYAGKKAGMRPTYEAVLAAVARLGEDVEVAPKKTCVSLRRSKQFALVQASTAGRVDLGLILKGVAPGGRLEAAGSFNAMCTHRVRLARPEDVDAEVRGWLKRAYDAS